MEQHINDLSMLLIYLTGWEEDKRRRKNTYFKYAESSDEKVFRSWKHYKFEIIDQLQSQGLIQEIPGGKSLLVTGKGKMKGEELKKKYLQ